MKKILFAFLLILSLPSYAASPLPFEEMLYKGKAFHFYGDASDLGQQKLIEMAKGAQLAEKMAFVAQTSLRLRRDMAVGFESCGTANALFNPQRSAIVICSEFIDLIAKAAINDKDFAMRLHNQRIKGARLEFFRAIDPVLAKSYITI